MLTEINILRKYLEKYRKYTREEIFEERKEKFLNIGKQKSFKVFSYEANWIKKENIFGNIKDILSKFKKELIIVSLLIFAAFLYFI